MSEIVLRDETQLECTGVFDSREAFERFTDLLFVAAETLWPSPEEGEQDEHGRPPAKAVRQYAEMVSRMPPPAAALGIAEQEHRGVGPDEGGRAPGFDAALHALSGAARRAKMLELKDGVPGVTRAYSAKEIARMFGTTDKAVSVACTYARHERREAADVRA